MLWANNTEQECPCHLIGAGTCHLKGFADACRLQGCQIGGKARAFRGQEKAPLAPVMGTGLLSNEAPVDQLLEYAGKALFGYLQDVEKVGDPHPWTPVDEMQDPVMGTAESKFGQHRIRLVREIAVSEEQELYDRNKCLFLVPE